MERRERHDEGGFLAALGGLTVLAFVTAMTLRLTDAAPRAGTLHLVFAVGVLPLVLAAMGHFIPVLTRTGGAPTGVRALALLGLAAGSGAAALLLAGRPTSLPLPLAALAAFAAGGGMLGWLALRRRATLGRPHPGLAWYGAALACLLAALAAVPLMHGWPEWWPALRRFHLHLNLLGFLGLTALGTLQVLLPTATGRPDPDAARRLRRGWPLALAATIAVAAGAAFWPPLAGVGLLAWLAVLGPLFAGWRRTQGHALLALHGAGPSLAAAALGFSLALLAAGVGALLEWPQSWAVEGFVAAFLFPLVTGALTHLVPLWLRPGRSEAQAGMRVALGRWGGVRGGLFLLGGGLLLLGQPWGGGVAGMGLLLFLGAALSARE